MKKRTWKTLQKIPGVMTLRKATDDPETYLLRYYQNGRRKRKVVTAPDDKTALKKANKIATAETAKTHTPAELPPLAEAFDLAKADTERGPSASDLWNWGKKRFEKWLEAPDGVTWEHLTPAMIDQYILSMRDKAKNTIRLALQPIRQTDRLMARRYGTRRITDGLTIKHGRPSKEPPLITIEDVLDLLEATRQDKQYRKFAPAIALQGLAAMRSSEVYRLTWDRIDLKAGLVEISGQIKNQYSQRVILLPSIIIEILEEAARIPASKIQTVGPDPIVPGYSDLHGYGVGLRKAIRAWNKHVEWSGKDLRNCLPTWAHENGHAGDPLERYLGHAPTSITGQHYVARLTCRTRGEKNALDRTIEIQKNLIIGPWETAIKEKLGTQQGTQTEKNLNKVPSEGA